MKRSILIFLLCPFLSFAQGKNIDSLKTALKNAKSDTVRSKTLNALANATLLSDPAKAMDYTQQVIDMYDSIKVEEDQYLGEAYLIRANCFSMIGDYPRALESGLTSLAIAELNHISSLKIRSLNNIGRCYYNLGEFDKAEAYYQKALEAAISAGDKKQTAGACINLGSVCMNKDQYERSLSYFLKASLLYTEVGSKRSAANAYNNMGAAFDGLNKPDSALFYFQKAEGIFKELNDKGGLARANSNMAKEAFKKGDLPKALEYDHIALKLQEEISDVPSLCATYLDLGKIFTEQYKKSKQEQLFAKAKENFDEALAIAKDIGSIDNIMNIYQSLSLLEEKKGDYKSAYEHFKLYAQYKDSITAEENAEKAAKMQLQYEFDKKKQQIELLNKEKAMQELQIQKMKLEKELEEQKKKKK
jgi:tetratricopeptide (TPR) repeat protein